MFDLRSCSNTPNGKVRNISIGGAEVILETVTLFCYDKKKKFSLNVEISGIHVITLK